MNDRDWPYSEKEGPSKKEVDPVDEIGRAFLETYKQILRMARKIQEQEDLIDGIMEEQRQIKGKLDDHCKVGDHCPHKEL